MGRLLFPSLTVPTWIAYGLVLVLCVAFGASDPGAQQPGPVPSVTADEGRPHAGICVAGTHLVHVSGERDIVDADTREYDDAEYRCVPDQRLEDTTCINGRSVIVDGVAACRCAEGYAGAECRVCAPGYEPGPRRTCVLAPVVPKPIIDGAEQSLELGQERLLRASLDGARDFRWRIAEGGGCLIDPLTSRCSDTARGQQVVFRAPAEGDDVGMTHISVAVLGSFGPAGPSGSTTVTWVPAGHIPVTGAGAPYLQPILSAFTRFMRYRCVGAGMIGIARYGQPIGVWGLGRMHGRASLEGETACGDSTTDPYDPSSSNVQPDTPFRIGSVSKSVTAAVTRRTLKATWKALDPAVDPDDDAIEALRVFADNTYPAALFPALLFDYFAGNVPVPVVISEELTTHADERWTDVTVGHLLAHRSGLPRSAPSYEDTVTSNLPILRALATEADFQSQEQVLVNEVGALTVAFAKIFLGLSNAYLLPRATLSEWLVVIAGRVLAQDPGQYQYSNTGPAFWTTMVEHLTGQPFAGLVGYPDTHEDAVLKSFFAKALNEPTTASSGIFAAQTAVGISGYVSPEPEKRSWSDGQQTYYPVAWDVKRPHCVWADGVCDFTSWRMADPARVNWAWNAEQVHFAYDSTGTGAGTGGLATRASTFLKFMANYWVKGYQSNPRIGEARDNIWNVYTRHNGAGAGMLAWAMQLGNDGPVSWPLPPQDVQGRILDDFGNLTTYQCALPSGESTTLPDGVDIIVAINTDIDKKCVDDDSYTCDEAYSLLDNFILQGVCRVVWPE